MGFSSNLFTLTNDKYSDTTHFPDLNKAWNSATYSAQEFQIEWIFYEGIGILNPLTNFDIFFCHNNSFRTEWIIYDHRV
jgi:hypothetical protein